MFKKLIEGYKYEEQKYNFLEDLPQRINPRKITDHPKIENELFSIETKIFHNGFLPIFGAALYDLFHPKIYSFKIGEIIRLIKSAYEKEDLEREVRSILVENWKKEQKRKLENQRIN